MVEHSNNDGISDCMNDAFRAVLVNSHVINFNYHNHHYIFRKLHKQQLNNNEVLFVCLVHCVKCQCASMRRVELLEERRGGVVGGGRDARLASRNVAFPEFLVASPGVAGWLRRKLAFARGSIGGCEGGVKSGLRLSRRPSISSSTDT